MLLVIAVKNLLKYAKQNLIILFLMTVIVTLLFIGNTLLTESDHGLESTYVENFTSDIVIMPESEMSLSLFGANTPAIGEYFTIPVIQNHQDIVQFAESLDDVNSVVSQISGVAAMDINGRRYGVPLFGVDGDDYFRQFPHLEILEGSVLSTGQKGVMISEKRREEIIRYSGKPPEIGSDVKLSMYTDYGFKIRVVPLVGVFRYNSSNEVLDSIVISDSQTLRALNSISLAAPAAVETESVDDILGSGDIDDLFNDETLIVDESPDSEIDFETLEMKLDRTDMPPEDDLTGGAWHFILIDLKEGTNPKKVQQTFDTYFEENGFPLHAEDWRQAAGASAMLVLLLRFFYNGGFILVALAGLIAIINILFIAVFDRTKEIGTLRALGAKKSYIQWMIFSEITLLSLTAGILSVSIGFVFIKAVNSIGLSIPNSLIRSLLGKNILTMTFSPVMGLKALLTAFGLGIISAVLPVLRALKVQPIEAVSKG